MACNMIPILLLLAWTSHPQKSTHDAAYWRSKLAEMPSPDLLLKRKPFSLLPLSAEKRTVEQAIRIAAEFKQIKDRELEEIAAAMERDWETIRQKAGLREPEISSDEFYRQRELLYDEKLKFFVVTRYLFLMPEREIDNLGWPKDIFNPWTFKGTKIGYDPKMVPPEINMSRNYNAVDEFREVSGKYKRRF